MARPYRLYLTNSGKYYYIVDGKKKYLKIPVGMSQKQVQQINIKNIIGAPAKRIKRKKKRVPMRYTKKITTNDMLLQTTGGLPGYVFQPQKKILSLAELAEKADDTKNIIDLLKKAFITEKKDNIGLPPIESTPIKGKTLFEKDIPTPIGLASGMSPEEKLMFYQMREEAEKKRKEAEAEKKPIPPTSVKPKTETESPLKKRISKAKKPQVGTGDDGLYNDQIENILKKRLDMTVPVVARDQVDSLLDKVYNKNFFSAVINTDPSSSSGRHWRCIVIDNRDDFPSAEYFDPLCESVKPETELLDVMRKICRRMNPEKYMKYKFSKIRRQNFLKSNCGYHCMKFIEDRYNGVPFEEASGYKDFMMRQKGKGGAPDDSMDGEGDLKKYEKEIKTEFTEYL
jgi:hypothetical protein